MGVQGRAIGNRVLQVLAIGVLCFTGCDREEPPQTETIETEFGPIKKTSRPNSEHDPDVGRYEYFIANGFAKEISGDDRRVGRSELRMFNPSAVTSRIDITLYFDNKAPVALEQRTLDPLKNTLFMEIPGELAPHFDDSHAWGMRIVSDVPVITDHILAAGIAPPGDIPFMGNYLFKGGVSDQLAHPGAATEWYFGDAFELIYEDEATANFPFNEFEWYHILNPGQRDADVTLHCYYAGGQYEAYEFPVNAERVRVVSNRGMVLPNVSFGLVVSSTEPVVVQAERFIRDFHDMQEWGAWIHNTRPGLPGPIAANPVRPQPPANSDSD